MTYSRVLTSNFINEVLKCRPYQTRHIINQINHLEKNPVSGELEDIIKHYNVTIDDLKTSHCSVNPKQVEKFTNAYDHLDSDSWISEILNAKVNVNKLRLVIADPKCGEDGKNIDYLWSKNVT